MNGQHEWMNGGMSERKEKERKKRKSGLMMHE